MERDTNKSIARSAAASFAGTLLSRFSGVARDIALAFAFGGSVKIASFMVAYRFANLLRRLFGDGAAQYAFIPHFEALQTASPKAAALFFRDLIFSMALLLAGVIGALEGVWYLAKGGGGGDIARLTMIMLPGLFFICLYAFSGAYLQCRRRFFGSSFAPAVFNLTMIGAVLMRSSVFDLALWVLFAFFLQWLLIWILNWRQLRLEITWKEFVRPRIFSSDMRALLRPVMLILVGISAAQINSAADALFACFSDAAGPAYLWYAIRLQQLPLALFGIAFAGAILPPLSRAAKAGDWQQYSVFLNGALLKVGFLMAFATGAIWLLGESITSLVFQYGLFSGHDVVLTTVCLKAYSLALLPSTIVLILSSGLYARKSYFEPVAASLVAILFNIALNALFVFTFHWGAASVALATSISAFINCGLLYGLFKRGAAIAFSKREKGNFLRVIGWIGFSFALVYYLQGYLPAGNIISIMAIGGLYTALVFAPFVKKARKNFAGF